MTLRGLPRTLLFDGMKNEWLDSSKYLDDVEKAQLRSYLHLKYWEPILYESRLRGVEQFFQTFEYHIYRMDL